MRRKQCTLLHLFKDRGKEDASSGNKSSPTRRCQKTDRLSEMPLKSSYTLYNVYKYGIRVA